MNDYFKIINIQNKCEFKSDLCNGEFQIYDKNIKQKKLNSSSLTFIFNNKDISISNFGYSKDNSFMTYIYQDCIAIYDLKILQTTYILELPQELKKNLHEYANQEKRNFVKKMFSRISFLDLNFKSNNLFINEKGNIVIVSSSILF